MPYPQRLVFGIVVSIFTFGCAAALVEFEGGVGVCTTTDTGHAVSMDTDQE